jgi:hypothetical protein
MQAYELYPESGPKKKKTMVHVLEHEWEHLVELSVRLCKPL